jgi:hypothetical protein
MKYPLLPLRRDDGRVIFPYGTIRGWYTHIEIREALKYGAKIEKMYKCHYFLKVCKPFASFVDELYNVRKQYKKEKNRMEYVAKLMMNSLYGKFGQRFRDKDNWIHESMIDDKLIEENDIMDRRGNYVRIKKDSYPAVFCIPIWASYVTAYGRIKLHREILKHDPVYVDTDSLMIDHELPTSDKLGELKLEMKIKRGIIVRPKFYALEDSNNKEYVKIKGLGHHLTMLGFNGLLKNPKISYKKFAKFKESLRQGFIPNEIIDTHKEFSLEDQKRLWKNTFNPDILEDSESIEVMENVAA